MTALDELTTFVSLVHETFDEHNQQRHVFLQALNKEVSPDNKSINNCINAPRVLEVEEEESDLHGMVPLNPKERLEYDIDASTPFWPKPCCSCSSSVARMPSERRCQLLARTALLPEETSGAHTPSEGRCRSAPPVLILSWFSAKHLEDMVELENRNRLAELAKRKRVFRVA